MDILVTGASGFIGSHICQEALSRGFNVWAGMRWSSSKQYLPQPELRFATLDLSNPQTLREQLRDCKRRLGGKGWDYVVHAAGAPQSRSSKGFFRTNAEGTRNLVEALAAEGMSPRRFVLISSLSVYGAVREARAPKGSPHRYLPILPTDTPKPNTAYGQSKLQAERLLAETASFPWVKLRPTGVKGPRARDYFLMARSIKGHADFAVGLRPQELTFIYVLDLVQAVFLALESPAAPGNAYFLSDGGVYASSQFSRLLRKELGNPWVVRLRAPLCLLWLVCAVSGAVCSWWGKLTTLNLDKYRILSQRNWQCDISAAERDLGYRPAYGLERGVAETVAWYKGEGWL